MNDRFEWKLKIPLAIQGKKKDKNRLITVVSLSKRGIRKHELMIH